MKVRFTGSYAIRLTVDIAEYFARLSATNQRYYHGWGNAEEERDFFPDGVWQKPVGWLFWKIETGTHSEGLGYDLNVVQDHSGLELDGEYVDRGDGVRRGAGDWTEADFQDLVEKVPWLREGETEDVRECGKPADRSDCPCVG